MVKDVRVRLLQLLQFMLLTTSSTAAENATRAPLGRIVAYIGVRDGSQRCPRKNIKAFWGDASLLDVKIRVLREVKGLTGIVVSSDSEEMLERAARYEGVTTIARDPFYATSTVSVADYFEHVADELEGLAETVLYAPVTAPLLEARDFEMLIAEFAASDPDRVDAAAFVLERPGHFWFDGAPLNYDPTYRENSQLAPPLLQLVSARPRARRSAFLTRSPWYAGIQLGHR